jgi:hypothetical protein
MLGVDRDGPREAALWFLVYLVQRSDSVSLTTGDVVEQLQRRGFVHIKSDELIPEITGLVLARKPT